MKKNERKPFIDEVIYHFKGKVSEHIDVVPIANRLLTEMAKARTTAPHKTNFYRVIWFQEGCPTHSVDFTKINITSPSILFVHKDRIHKFDHQRPHDGKVLIFTDDFIIRNETDRSFLKSAKIFSQNEQPIVLSTIDSRLEELFAQIEIEIQNEKHPYHGQVLYHLLNAFLYSAENCLPAHHPQRTTPSASRALVNAFFDLVDKNITNRLSVEGYACQLNVSVNKLNTAVKEIVKKTAKQIVTERLLIEIKRLLVHTDLSIKEIGFEMGFNEPTNFIKFFHVNIGSTPMEFREGNS